MSEKYKESNSNTLEKIDEEPLNKNITMCWAAYDIWISKMYDNNSRKTHRGEVKHMILW